MLDGKTLLLTGGTGSFGQAFVRHVLAHHAPSQVLVYSRDEQKQMEMAEALPHPALHFVLGDVRDATRLRQVMTGVDVVIHAAALKHVPTGEHHPMECIKTNVLGADHLIQAAQQAGVASVVALSTDKAASPVSLYGASKLAADKLFVAANRLPGNATRFSVVRHGNVVGSRGSVVPHFDRLLSEGTDYLPITDERMTRFWLTPEAAVDVVLRALERMQGGEIFVPKAPSIRITELASAMAPDVPQRVVGRRPGEKLHEAMCPADDSHLTLAFDDHYVLQPSVRTTTDYRTNGLGEYGEPVPDGFVYSSGDNPEFLSLDDLQNWHEARTNART
ncbi:MAG: UDP-N-acetylglucosamine 4,6-dehydratase (inverting) [Pseudomonadota bacterium]